MSGDRLGAQTNEVNGGSDGTQTRDLRRDRPTAYLTISAAVPIFRYQSERHFGPKSERFSMAPLAEVTSYVHQQLASPPRLEALPAFEDFEILRLAQVPQP